MPHHTGIDRWESRRKEWVNFGLWAQRAGWQEKDQVYPQVHQGTVTQKVKLAAISRKVIKAVMISVSMQCFILTYTAHKASAWHQLYATLLKEEEYRGKSKKTEKKKYGSSNERLVARAFIDKQANFSKQREI